MDIRMIALDLDGTLYNSEKEIAPKTLASLRRAADMGIEVVPATGRPLGAVPANVRELDFVNYIITCNGAALYDRNGKCLYEITLDTALSAELVRKLNGYDISLDAFIGGKSYRYASNMAIIDKLCWSDKMKEYIRSTRNTVDDLEKYILENDLPVQKLTLNFTEDGRGGFVDRDAVSEMLGEYSDRIDVVCGGDHDLEVTVRGVNKGSGLKKLAELTGTGLPQTMMIGDSENDLEAVKCAGIGIAMGNSEKCILDAADHVTLSNDEDGIAAALEKYIF